MGTQVASAAHGRRLGRAPHGALGRLEPDDGKPSRPVLRGGCGGNTAPLLGGENRLIHIELPDATEETNAYRADGLRHSHEDTDGPVYFLWDEQNVLHERTSAASGRAVYTQLPGIWGGEFSYKRGANHIFLLPDFQGHTRQIANISGDVVTAYIYDAWGREVWPIVTTGNYLRPFGQHGYWRDTASRLYVRARHLRVDLGRWLSRDPLGFAGGDRNVYAYVAGRPVAAVDPSGAIFVLPAANWYVGPSRGANACCGYFDAKWDFRLQGNAGVAWCDGYFVQSVTTLLTVRRSGSPIWYKPTHVYEAWKIKKGDRVPDQAGHGYTDNFLNTVRYNDTNGTIAYRGVVRFYCQNGSTVGDEKWMVAHGWSYYGPCNKFTGAVMCFNGDDDSEIPPFWGDPPSVPPGSKRPEQSEVHTVNASWCCEGPSSGWSAKADGAPCDKGRSLAACPGSPHRLPYPPK